MGNVLVTSVLMILTSIAALSTARNVSGCAGDVKDLNIMGFFPHSGAFSGGQSLLSASMLTIDQINSMCVVPGYRLNLHPADTKCDAGVAIFELFQQLYTPPTKVMILGAGCSFVSETIARAAHHWNLVQMSYASVSPTLSEKKKFPTFARVAAPEVLSNPARLALLRHYGWSRVSIITQTLDLFSKTANDLNRRLKKNNFTILRSEIFDEDPTLQVNNLKDHDCRIIIGLFYEDRARRVFCEAYKVGLYGRRVVWILGSWYEPGWWKRAEDSISCSPEEMEEAVEGYIDVGIVYLNHDPVPSVSGWLPSDFLAAYHKKVNNQTLVGEHMAPQGYDAVWAMALALNATRQTLLDRGGSKGLEDFTYTDKDLSDLIYGNLLNVSFMGVRGPISFDSNGDPVGRIRIGRVQGGVQERVGSYNVLDSTSNQLEWSVTNPIIWDGGVIPQDSILELERTDTLTTSLYCTMCIIAAVGIVLAAFFLAFNIKLRHVKLVKMSSPRLNNVILLGCISCYMSVFVQDAGAGMGTTGCKLNTALLVMGISLAFGALFAKTWRVHRIFSNKKMKRKIVSDGQLLVIVGLLVVVNMGVLVIWFLTDPVYIDVSTVTVSEDREADVTEKLSVEFCVSEQEMYFLGTLYGIQALMLLCGTLLAYETRNVHYPELNDSKLIGMCIYNATILAIPAVVLGVAMNPPTDIKYAIHSALVILGTTVTQCIIFVPKVMLYDHLRKVHSGSEVPSGNEPTGRVTTVMDSATVRSVM